MTGPVSVFQGLAQETTAKKIAGWRGKVGSLADRDKLDAPDGKLILLSDSRDLFAGFDQHYGGYTPNIPAGYTTLRQLPGQTHSLMLTGGERDYTAGQSQVDNGTTVYSRLTWDPAWKRIHFAMWFSIMGEDVLSYASLGFALDMQKWDNSDRGHFRCEFQDNGTDASLPRWKVAKNDGTMTTVPNSFGHVTGENENKGGWNFARMSVDLTTPTGTHGTAVADTVGQYLQLQSNDGLFDLTGLGAGQGYQTPQAADPIGDFRGGCNPGVSLFRSTRKPTLTPMLLIGGIYVVVEE